MRGVNYEIIPFPILKGYFDTKIKSLIVVFLPGRVKGAFLINLRSIVI